MKNNLLLSFALLAVFSCKSISNRSSVSRDWGQTLTPGGSLACQEDVSDEKLLQSYIREQLNVITKGNPRVFQGDLAADRFCIVPLLSAAIDAGASPDGSLFINSGVLQASETDAQFAAVIAHELAHITLRHGEADIADFVRTHPQYLATYSDLTREKQQIRRYDILHRSNEEDWTAYIDKLKVAVREKWSVSHSSNSILARNGQECASIASWEKPDAARIAMQKALPSPDYEIKLCHQFFQEFNAEYREGTLFSKWKEVEADEAGYEYFLRAGYPEDEYAQFFANTLHLGGAKEPNCDRTDKDHPSDCWRAIDIRAELKKRLYDKPDGLHQHKFGDRLQTLRAQYASKA